MTTAIVPRIDVIRAQVQMGTYAEEHDPDVIEFMVEHIAHDLDMWEAAEEKNDDDA